MPGNFTCEGTKKRILRTEHFGARGLDAFETPLPSFADYGAGRLDENGAGYIVIDPVFAETVSRDALPAVFLTPCGEGTVYVGELSHDVVTVRGTPGLAFSWETRYPQANACAQRLREKELDELDLGGPDYDSEAAVDLEHTARNMAAAAGDYLRDRAALAVDYGAAGCEYFEEYERSMTAV